MRSKNKFIWIKESFVNSKKISLIQRNRFVYITDNFFGSTKLFLIQRNFLLCVQSTIYTRLRVNIALSFFCNISKYFRIFQDTSHSKFELIENNLIKNQSFSTPRKQFLWIKEMFLWYTVKENISLIWRKFCWLKKICFNQKNYLQLKEIFSVIQRNCFLSVNIETNN